MAKGFKDGAGGGRSELNFRVVGSPEQPSTPRENDIWVSTSDEIITWVFDVSEPVAPVAGMVWIQVDFRSSAPLNALKRNGIHLYPVGVKQYDGSNWTDVTGKLWNGAEWVEIRLPYYYIVNAGGAADYAGGWASAGNAHSAQNSDGSIYLKTTTSASGNITMKSGISNFAEYSTMKIVQSTSVNGHIFKIINETGTTFVSVSTYTSVSPISVDLASLGLSKTGLYRFLISGDAIGGTSGASTLVTKVWLE